MESKTIDMVAGALLSGLAAFYAAKLAGSPLPQWLISVVPPFRRLRAAAETAWDSDLVWPGIFYCNTCRSFYLTSIAYLCWALGSDSARSAVAFAAGAGLAVWLSGVSAALLTPTPDRD